MLIADDKYPCSNRENLPPPIQMQLSKKVKALFRDFTAVLESASNFEHFEKKE